MIEWSPKRQEVITKIDAKAQHAFHKGPVGTVAAYKDGNLVATGGPDMNIILTNIKTGRVITTMMGHSDVIEGVGFSTTE